MKTVYTSLGFALGASAAALVPRDQCCFGLTASGGVSGVVGQLVDGQNRIDQTAELTTQVSQYTLNNGGIIDQNGRGCILTPGVTQFQCDAGVGPTYGFSVSSSGQLTYNGSASFSACPTGDYGGWNAYLYPVVGQNKCVNITLNTNPTNCSSSSGGSSSVVSAIPSGSAPAGNYSAPVGTAPYQTAPYGTAPASSVPVASATVPSAPVGSAPASSVLVSSASAASVPVGSASASSVPASGTPMSAPTGSAPASSNVAPYGTAPYGTAPSGTAPYGTAPYGTAPSGTAPYGTSPSPSESETAPYGTGPSPSAPYGTGAQSAPYGTAPSQSAASETAPYGTAPQSAPYGTAPSGSAPASSAPAGSAPASSAPAGTNTASTGTAAAASGTASGTTSASACQTSLSGAYQTPHAIIPVNSQMPTTSYGTQYFAYLSANVNSTVFSFDIPSSYAGKQCTVIFLFPEQSQLETSSFTISGSGGLTFDKLSSAVPLDVTYSTLPSVDCQLDQISNVTPGNSYIVSTGDCAAGTTESIEVSATGSLNLTYFEDWNPSPIGLFMTSC